MRNGSPPHERPRLLIVDDEPRIRSTLNRLLCDSYDIVEAGDGREAHERLTTGEFDVVLSDITMPHVTGVELLRLVREHDIDVPVVLMTGQPSIDTAIEAVSLGAFSYIKKPFEHAALDAVLERDRKSVV